MAESQRGDELEGLRKHSHFKEVFLGYQDGLTIRRMSETPTTTTSQKSIEIHLQLVLQYASNLYCRTFGAPKLWGKGNAVSTPPICAAVPLPFALQYASHL